MKKDVTIELVKEFDRDFDGACKLIHRNGLKYQFSIPVQEIIDNGDIEEIYFILDTVIFQQNSGVDVKDVMDEYEVDIWDTYNEIPCDIQFETDNYIIRFKSNTEALAEELKRLGFSEYETVLYVKEIKACRTRVFAKNDSEIRDIIYGEDGDHILELIDESYPLETVLYEHGIDDIISIK